MVMEKATLLLKSVKAQPTGSYVYRIKFTNIFGWESLENGSVLLIL
jgi:hypothetical protein